MSVAVWGCSLAAFVSAHCLFYSRGAAFWKDLDEVISAATGGGRSLDDFLPLLSDGDFGAKGELPPEFLDSVGKVVDPDEIGQVLQEYL